MGKLERCNSCNGRKKILGMGGMQRDCPPCKGVGWIDLKIPLESAPVKNTLGDIVPVVKRKGRPPKEVLQT